MKIRYVLKGYEPSWAGLEAWCRADSIGNGMMEPGRKSNLGGKEKSGGKPLFTLMEAAKSQFLSGFRRHRYS
jgi:hypothetical protein